MLTGNNLWDTIDDNSKADYCRSTLMEMKSKGASDTEALNAAWDNGAAAQRKKDADDQLREMIMFACIAAGVIFMLGVSIGSFATWLFMH